MKPAHVPVQAAYSERMSQGCIGVPRHAQRQCIWRANAQQGKYLVACNAHRTDEAKGSATRTHYHAGHYSSLQGVACCVHNGFYILRCFSHSMLDEPNIPFFLVNHSRPL